jgi:hypothetical protein
MEVETFIYSTSGINSNEFCDLPVFGTTREVARCTKFLISRVHNGTLWLDKAYIIHVEDIHKLMGLSMDGKYVSQGFQGSGKHG